jgi:hypothetical protein
MAFSTFNSFHSTRTKRNLTVIPPSISGLQLWLDAKDYSTLTLSGTTVTSWGDKSGFSRNATPYNGNSNPIYNATGFNNLPAIQFSPSTGMASQVPANSMPLASSIFVVFQTSGSSTGGLIARDLNGGYPGGLNPYGANRLVGSGQNYQNYQSPFNLGAATGLNLFEIQVNNASYNEYVNGSVVLSNTTTNVYADTATNFFIATRTDKAVTLTGVISEIIVYNSLLTITQRQYIEGYLAWKWGIQTSLPVNHPYYNSKP